MNDFSSNRRGFMGQVGAGALGGILGFPGPRLVVEHQAKGWDMSWLDRLSGKHKQIFDLSNLDIGLRVVMNWLNAWEEVYGLRHPDVNAVVGIGGHAFPINATDAMYQKYPIGKLWNVTDPTTQQPAERNIFLEGGAAPPDQGAKVKTLQARGAIFWMCNNALHGVAGRIAAAVGQKDADVYADLRANGLNPGVILVPAHTMLVGMCQERGCSYEALP